MTASEEPYVVSDERLAEIRAMTCEDMAAAGVGRDDLAGAVYDLLAERDAPQPTRSEDVERLATELLGLLRPWVQQPSDVRAACMRLTISLAARGVELPLPEGDQ